MRTLYVGRKAEGSIQITGPVSPRSYNKLGDFSCTSKNMFPGKELTKLSKTTSYSEKFKYGKLSCFSGSNVVIMLFKKRMFYVKFHTLYFD